MAKFKNRKTSEIAFTGEVPMVPDIPGVGAPPIEVDEAEFQALNAPELIAEVSMPICEELPSEFGLHIDTDIPPPAATTLRRIAIALDRRQVCLASGIRVTNPTQALRYLLEQMSIRSAAVQPD